MLFSRPKPKEINTRQNKNQHATKQKSRKQTTHKKQTKRAQRTKQINKAQWTWKWKKKRKTGLRLSTLTSNSCILSPHSPHPAKPHCCKLFLPIKIQFTFPIFSSTSSNVMILSGLFGGFFCWCSLCANVFFFSLSFLVRVSPIKFQKEKKKGGASSF